MMKKHGGKRRGAGRPELPAAAKRSVRVVVFLTESEKELILTRGNAHLLKALNGWNTAQCLGQMVRMMAVQSVTAPGERKIFRKA